MIGKFLSKEFVTDLAAGTVGAAVSVPAKSLLFSKVSSEAKVQDALVLGTGVVLHGIGKSRIVKSAGTGMALAGAYSLIGPMIEGALSSVTGAASGAAASAGGAAGVGNVFMGTTDGSDVLMGSFGPDAYDYTSSEAGEMDY